MRESFLNLVRLGIGTVSSFKFFDERSGKAERQDSIDWKAVKALAEQQGLSAVVLDGIEKLPATSRPPQELLLEWIGETLQSESIYETQQKEAVRMANLFQNNGIRTYVLKGAVVAECYPKPSHRPSVDMDCYLLPEKSDFDAWNLGNDLIKTQGFEVAFDYYKNSTFYLNDMTVENHQYFTPFRGNKRLAALEKWLQSQFKNGLNGSRIEGTELWRPPVMVTALFLIEHAYSHFLHEGLTWRMILDWMMFSKKHKDEIDWSVLDAKIDEFGFRKFYDSYYRLGLYLIGEFQVSSSSTSEAAKSSVKFQDKLMLEDVWSELDVHDTVKGIKGKLALVGNTWRARWKYKYFSEDTMLKALWIQVKGVLFEKNPQLN